MSDDVVSHQECEMPRATWLHKLCKKAPGDLPAWLISTGGCFADAVEQTAVALSLVLSTIVSFGLVFFVSLSPTAAVLIGMLMTSVLLFFADFMAVERVRTVERKARAINRRASARSKK